MALFMVVGTHVAAAQSTADAYFHEAAQQYVADDRQAARQTVEQGLEVAPSDSRLLALRKKLRQEKNPDRSGKQRDSSSATSNRQKQKDQSSEEAGNDGNKSSEKNQSSQSGTRNDSRKQKGSTPSNTKPGTRPRSADSMRPGPGGQPIDSLSRTQAERLLRALEGQERRLLRQIRIRSSKRQTVEKDW